MRIAVYPGTFDPITNGHIDILERAVNLFDRVIVAIAVENYKDTLFDLEERKQLVEAACRHVPRTEVRVFEGLLMDFVETVNAQAIIRGLRAVSDFEYEMQMAMMNKRLNNNVETVFLMSATKYSFLSSSIIKQVALLDGSVKGLVPAVVEEALKRKYAMRVKAKEGKKC